MDSVALGLAFLRGMVKSYKHYSKGKRARNGSKGKHHHDFEGIARSESELHVECGGDIIIPELQDIRVQRFENKITVTFPLGFGYAEGYTHDYVHHGT